MLRLLNITVIAALVLAATAVYTIKFDSTLQAERLGRLRAELQRERDGIATLRAEWTKLDTPGRIRELAERHLQLRHVDAKQFDDFRNLPERSPVIVQPPPTDPIGAMLAPAPDVEATGSLFAPPAVR